MQWKEEGPLLRRPLMLGVMAAVAMGLPKNPTISPPVSACYLG